jgi:hypothetical protein
MRQRRRLARPKFGRTLKLAPEVTGQRDDASKTNSYTQNKGAPDYFDIYDSKLRQRKEYSKKYID